MEESSGDDGDRMLIVKGKPKKGKKKGKKKKTKKNKKK